MKFVTVINDEIHPGFSLLRLSCALKEIELTALVSNDWDFPSRRIKDEMVSNYLDQIPEDEIIFFTDGNDALMTATEDEIMEKFLEFDCDVVFSAETQCWPEASLVDEYPQTSPSPYRFLNSGGYMGKAGAIRLLLKDKAIDFEKHKTSDQYLWTQRYLKNTHFVKLDTNCNIFCTFSPEIGQHLIKKDPLDYTSYNEFRKQWFDENFLIANGRFYNKITHTWPCQAHFNGAAKLLISNDLIEMVFSNIKNYKSPIFIMRFLTR